MTIMEAKALACNIVPGRLPRGPAFEEWIKKYVPQGGPANLHPEQPPPGAPNRRRMVVTANTERPTSDDPIRRNGVMEY